MTTAMLLAAECDATTWPQVALYAITGIIVLGVVWVMFR